MLLSLNTRRHPAGRHCSPFGLAASASTPASHRWMRAANRKRAQPSSATRVVRRVQPERRSASASGSLLEATANAKQQSAPANSPRCYRAGCSHSYPPRTALQWTISDSAMLSAACAAAVALRQKEQRGPVTTQARRPLLPDKLSHEHDSSQAAANGASRHAAIARPSPLAIAPAAAAAAEAILRAVGELSGAAHTKRRHKHSRRGPPSDVESTRAELFRGLLASAVPAIGFTR